MPDLGIEDRIVVALRRIMRAVDLHSRRLLEEHGLTGPQLATLQTAARLGAVSASELARAVHLGQPTLTGILARLESRGLVVRRRSDTDRRSVAIEVTDQGRALLACTPSLLQDRFRQRLQALEDWERAMILATVQRVAAMMDADGLSAAPHLVGGEIETPAPREETPCR